MERKINISNPITTRQFNLDVTSRLSEAEAIFGSQDKRPDHFRLEGIAVVEVQLPKPEDEACSVRITSQVSDIFHEHKHAPVLLIVEGLAVGSRKLHIAFTDYNCAIDNLSKYAGFRLRPYGEPLNQCLFLSGRRSDSRGIEQLLHVECVVESAILRHKLRSLHEVGRQPVAVGLNHCSRYLVVHHDAFRHLANVAHEFERRREPSG